MMSGIDLSSVVIKALRHGKPTVLRVEAGKMHADGHIFTCSDNEVWLTDSVPAGYLGFGVVQ